MTKFSLLFFISTLSASAWVESVEFPWDKYPRPLWEKELVRLKNTGISHVSLPPGKDPAQLSEVIRIVRRLNLEADLEGAVPESLQSLTTTHGGPLTDPAVSTRVSALAPNALIAARSLLTAGKAVVWSDVEDTLDTSGFHAGAVNFAGDEGPAALPIRRNAQLSRYWGHALGSLNLVAGAPGAPPPAPAQSMPAQQFGTADGISFASVANTSAKALTGDIRVYYSPLKRVILVPGITVPAHDSLWLPVNVPLMAGPFCKACTAFATVDHLVYATAELTAMEYENGILAMEFCAPTVGEVILQLSRQPSGPFVAGGKPTEFEWDEHADRVRLSIPKGTGPDSHVRIGLAIDAPDATAFFENARVLIIGETNNLTAEFSSTTIAQRSRLRLAPEMAFSQEPAKDDLKLMYRIRVPDTAVPGDHADLALEADGEQMSHVRPQLLRAVSVRFPDATTVKLAANSLLPLSPATIPVNRRTGREITLSVRNNAPEIRTIHVELTADGLDFSPPKMDVVVGASSSRDIQMRIFPTTSATGLHNGEVKLSGGLAEPVQLLVFADLAATAYSSGGLYLIENSRHRAAFIPGRWLEFVDKESGQNLLPVGGIVFNPGTIAIQGDTLVFSGQKTYRILDLELLAPKPKK